MDIPLFFHLAGIIIALGAVTVIDSLGFFSRNDVKKTQVTIGAHYITKPLIWIGTLVMIISWLFLYDGSLLSNIKSVLMVVLVLNGSFLSFYVSPRLIEHEGKKKVLDSSLKMKITLSALISFVSWWSLVVITVLLIQ